MTTTVIGRPAAVHQIAAPLADRSAFVIVTPPDLVADIAPRLGRLPTGWTAYLDNGTPVVVATGEPKAIALMAALSLPGGITAVVTVPKTVPAVMLTEAVGQEVPADGSQDLIMLHSGWNRPIIWPMLFVDALEQVDPRATAQIRAMSQPLSN